MDAWITQWIRIVTDDLEIMIFERCDYFSEGVCLIFVDGCVYLWFLVGDCGSMCDVCCELDGEDKNGVSVLLLIFIRSIW